MASDGSLGVLSSEMAGNIKDLQVVTFASSSSDHTTADIINTIREFKKANPHGKIIGVGHSLGAENLLEASYATGANLDLLITIDPRGTSTYASGTFNYASLNVSNGIN